MALSSSQLNEVLAVATNYIHNEIPMLFTQANPLYELMLKRKKYVSGGNKIQMPISDATVASVGYINGVEADTINTNTNRTHTFGELDWKYFYSALTVTLDEYNKTHDSDEAIISLIEAKTENLKESIIDTLAADFYESGTAGNKQFSRCM
jgi:hypothetical protein